MIIMFAAAINEAWWYSNGQHDTAHTNTGRVFWLTMQRAIEAVETVSAPRQSFVKWSAQREKNRTALKIGQAVQSGEYVLVRADRLPELDEVAVERYRQRLTALARINNFNFTAHDIDMVVAKTPTQTVNQYVR